MKKKQKEWINVIFLIITLVINTLGAKGWINGISQKEVSDRYLTLITPAPLTFSIWSVIYFLLIISVIVMILKREDLYYGRAIDEISFLFWLSCIFNIAWIISFSFIKIGLSVVFIFGILITVSLILQKLTEIQIGRYLLLPTTFGLYGGWLFIATVVNIALWLVKIRWTRFGLSEGSWAVIILIVSVFLTILVLRKHQNAIFPIPIAWAYFGIYSFLISPTGFQGHYKFLQILALLGMTFLIGISAIQFYNNGYKIIPKKKQYI